MDELLEFSERKGIPIIEDACQAHGAEFSGRRCGSFGAAGCFSFYSTKNLTVGGDGGMVTTNDSKLASEIEKLRNCGRKSFYEHDAIGYTSRLNTANAAIGRVQLRRLDGWNEKRREIANLYFKGLAGTSVALPPKGDGKAMPVFHLFSIRHGKRDAMREFLKQKGVETGMNYPVSLHLQPVYAGMFGYAPGTFPNSEALSSGVLCLPMHVNLRAEDVKFVCDSIVEFEAKHGK